MSLVIYTDVETLTKAWLASTSVGTLVRRQDGGTNIFLAMPASSPLPAVIVSRVGGGPSSSELPTDVSRLSFACWASSRHEVSDIAYAVMGELDSLSRLGGYTLGNATLAAAEVLSLLWLPDPESDTARYVLDALITTVATS